MKIGALTLPQRDMKANNQVKGWAGTYNQPQTYRVALALFSETRLGVGGASFGRVQRLVQLRVDLRRSGRAATMGEQRGSDDTKEKPAISMQKQWCQTHWRETQDASRTEQTQAEPPCTPVAACAGGAPSARRPPFSRAASTCRAPPTARRAMRTRTTMQTRRTRTRPSEGRRRQWPWRWRRCSRRQW